MMWEGLALPSAERAGPSLPAALAVLDGEVAVPCTRNPL